MAITPVGFFDPSPTGGTTSNLPGFRGIPRRPGESLADYQVRLQEAQAPYQQANAERKQIEDLSKSEEAKSRSILDEQTGIQTKRLNDLAALLAQQQSTAFNRDIPGIAETAQGQGMLETSGFGNALSRDYTNLEQDTSMQLAKQALADRDLQVSSLGEIGKNANDLTTGGLERQFSVTDNARAEDLAKELARLGQPAPTPAPKRNLIQDVLGGAAAGSAFGPQGAIVGGISGGVSGNK